MRVAWFTPGTGGSGVVQYSRQVVSAMRSVADTVLFTPGAAEHFPSGIETIDFDADPGSLEGLTRFDAVFYNLGNHVHYHGRIWEIARSRPGILILHDRVLHHLFLEYYVDHLQRPDLYRERMIRLYGWRGRDFAELMLEHRRGGSFQGADIRSFSFLEEALAVATGAVVHSRWHAEIVEAVWSGPLCPLWLPVHSTPRGGSQPAAGSRAARTDQRLTLLTLGHVEFNKHADKVVAALGSDSTLGDKARYLIAGAYHPDSGYVRKLGAEVTGRSLARTVRLLGHLPQAELDRQAALADVFVNLRYPNFEGSSASLMYQLPFGKPVVVYRAGSFAELPDDAVVKVTPGDQAELDQRLRELVEDERLRDAIGAAGAKFAERRTPQAYVKELTSFGADVADRAPRYAAVSRVGRELAMLGADPRLGGVRRIADEAITLFGPLER